MARHSQIKKAVHAALATTLLLISACTAPEAKDGKKSSHPMARQVSVPNEAAGQSEAQPSELSKSQPASQPSQLTTSQPATQPSGPTIKEMLDAARSENYVRHIENARADIEPILDQRAHGTITFTKTSRGMYMEIEMNGLSPGEHVFHLHEYGDCNSDDLESAGPHFSPLSLEKGDADRDHALMHLWHLGFLQADKDGYAKLTRIEPHRTFEGTNSILGRSVVVHDIDSGPRIACGLIGVVEG